MVATVTLMLQVKLETPTAENSIRVALTQGKFAIVDINVDPVIWEYKWRAIKWNFRWYAYSTKMLDGTIARVAMHRLIAHTPPGQVCHHLNKNSLDNRKANLLNMTNREHAELHGIRRWGIGCKTRTAKTIKKRAISNPA